MGVVWDDDRERAEVSRAEAEIGSIQTPELSPVKASPISAGPARADGKEAIIILRNKGLFSG